MRSAGRDRAGARLANQIREVVGRTHRMAIREDARHRGRREGDENADDDDDRHQLEEGDPPFFCAVPSVRRHVAGALTARHMPQDLRGSP